jgi:hypothetical protein
MLAPATLQVGDRFVVRQEVNPNTWHKPQGGYLKPGDVIIAARDTVRDRTQRRPWFYHNGGGGRECTIYFDLVEPFLVEPPIEALTQLIGFILAGGS